MLPVRDDRLFSGPTAGFGQMYEAEILGLPGPAPYLTRRAA
jgi:hypothetical protein